MRDLTAIGIGPRKQYLRTYTIANIKTYGILSRVAAGNTRIYTHSVSNIPAFITLMNHLAGFRQATMKFT